MTDVRPLRLHDLPFAYRLVGRGISFDVQLSLTAGEDTLRHVLLTGTGRTQVYVLRLPDGGGLGQLHFPAGQKHVRLAYLAPSFDEGGSEDVWLSLLDGLAVMAGRRNGVSIIAEVDEGEPGFEVLRRAGFATYTRQEVWLRAPGAVSTSPVALRPLAAADSSALMGLYGALVPGLIKHVEPPPTGADSCYVVDGPRGLCGVVVVYEGVSANLIETYLLPDSRVDADKLLDAALLAARAEDRPVYYRMRDYMGSLSGALDRADFECVTQQVVMARHTAARIMQQEFKLAGKVESGVPLPTSTSINP